MQSAEQREKIGQPKPITKTPEEIRSVILNAVGDGFNTMNTLLRETGLPNEILTREIEILQNILIFVHPGPPIESYWIRSKAPKGRIAIDADTGKAYEIREPKQTAKQKRESFEKARAAHAESQAADDVELEENFPLPETAETVDGDDQYFPEFPRARLESHPDNPRGFVDEGEPEFHDLVNSIHAHGVQQPLIITPIAGTPRFRIVMGHRRDKAAGKAGREFVPVIVRHYESRDVEEDVMLIENIQRQNLKPVAEARAFKRIYDKENQNIHAVARRTGCTQGYISGKMKLLNLDVRIQIMVDRGELAVGAGEIISVLQPDDQKKILARAQRMKQTELREVVYTLKANNKRAVPPERRQQVQERRVTTDEEKFTRSGALKMLDNLGGEAYITVNFLRSAFDDVCIDTCLESKDETVCQGCPVPRMIASIARRQKRKENA